jgi:hypothetical protein
MRVTFRIEDQLLKRARIKAEEQGRSLNDIVREFLLWIANGGDPKASYEEIQRLAGFPNANPQKINSALE